MSGFLWRVRFYDEDLNLLKEMEIEASKAEDATREAVNKTAFSLKWSSTTTMKLRALQ